MKNIKFGGADLERLKWRSRRSMLELDVHLGRFLEYCGLENLTSQELAYYVQVLEIDDNDLLMLLQGKAKLLENNFQSLINKIIFYGAMSND